MPGQCGLGANINNTWPKKFYLAHVSLPVSQIRHVMLKLCSEPVFKFVVTFIIKSCVHIGTIKGRKRKLNKK